MDFNVDDDDDDNDDDYDDDNDDDDDDYDDDYDDDEDDDGNLLLDYWWGNVTLLSFDASPLRMAKNSHTKFS